MSLSKQVAAAVIILDECSVFGRKKNRKRREMWAKNWLLGIDRFTHLNLLNFIRNDSPEDYKNYFRMSDVLAKVKPLIVKQDIVMRNAITPEARIAATLRFLATGRSFEDLKFAVWIRETGSGPPTQVRANSEPSPTEGPGEPSRTRPSPARGAPHREEFDSWEPEPSRTHESDSYVYGHLKGRLII
jgi:hypothetical protein